MHQSDAVFLEELCPKLRVRRWRQSLHEYTDHTCIYCGKPSESIDHVWPRSRGGLSVTENCVPSCLSCNGTKRLRCLPVVSPSTFLRSSPCMAIRAWLDGDLRAGRSSPAVGYAQRVIQALRSPRQWCVPIRRQPTTKPLKGSPNLTSLHAAGRWHSSACSWGSLRQQQTSRCNGCSQHHGA